MHFLNFSGYQKVLQKNFSGFPCQERVSPRFSLSRKSHEVKDCFIFSVYFTPTNIIPENAVITKVTKRVWRESDSSFRNKTKAVPLELKSAEF